MGDFAARLAGGDRRSTGAADAVAREVARNPSRFDELWECLRHADPLVRMRAADALEKATRRDASALQARTMDLIGGALDDGTPEVRWHLLAMCARLHLTERDAGRLMQRLRSAFEADSSRIVRVMALQAAVEVGRRHPGQQGEARRMLEMAQSSPVASLRARAGKLKQSGVG
jgi:hypothetical protein